MGTVERDSPSHTQPESYTKHLYDRYKWANLYIQNKIILDIPTGVGWGASLLKGYKKLYCIDNSEEAINEGIHLYNNLDFIIGDMTNIPIINNFIECIICLEGYEHLTLEDQIIFIKESYRILKKDGIIVLQAPMKYKDKIKDSGNIFHLHEPFYEEFITTIYNLFKINSEVIIDDPYLYHFRIILEKL